MFSRTQHHSGCSKCFPSALKPTSRLLTRLFDITLTSLISTDVIVSEMCLNSSSVWELFECTSLLVSLQIKNYRNLGMETLQATICDLSVYLTTLTSSVCYSTILHTISICPLVFLNIQNNGGGQRLTLTVLCCSKNIGSITEKLLIHSRKHSRISTVHTSIFTFPTAKLECALSEVRKMGGKKST